MTNQEFQKARFSINTEFYARGQWRKVVRVNFDIDSVESQHTGFDFAEIEAIRERKGKELNYG